MCCMWLAENTGCKNDAKNRHLGTIPQLCRAISLQLMHVSTIGKNLLSSNISSTCPHNMVNFGPLAAEIVSGVWGTPATFNDFRVLAALQNGTLVVGVSQTFRRGTEGATYVRQGDHHVGHWPTFLFNDAMHSLYWNLLLVYTVCKIKFKWVLSALCETYCTEISCPGVIWWLKKGSGPMSHFPALELVLWSSRQRVECLWDI